MKGAFEAQAEDKGGQETAPKPAKQNGVAKEIIRQRIWRQAVNRQLGRRLGRI